jgi:sulfoxide reductase heme-binding subunit YedZ
MLKRRWFGKSLVFLACLAPFILLLAAIAAGNLSPDPVRDITDNTGTWALRFLLITLSITPLRKLSGWNEIIKFRRMAGLFAFFYGFLHLTTYLWLDQFFSIRGIINDIAKRPFITAGTSAFVLLIPLAITSTRKWISRLGGRHWQLLHRLIYVSSVLGVVHYLWLVKADLSRPILYSVLLSVLLAYRLFTAMRSRSVQGFGRRAMPSYSQSHN